MLVLHVGPHKTATTWLQYNFHHNIKALEQAGWYYPQTGVRVRVAHHDLSDNPDEILDDASAKSRELKQIASRARERGLNILLSSEGFRHWEPKHLKRLQEIVAPQVLHTVYCVRDPISMLYSFWAQQVRTGMRLSFPEFSARHLDRAGNSSILNPMTEIRVLRDVEGAELTVLLYDEIRRQGRDIFDVFVSDVLRIAPLPHSDDARGNDRQPIEMTEFMRLVSLRAGKWSENADVQIGRVFHYMLPRSTEVRIVEAVGRVTDARHVMSIERDLLVLDRVERRLIENYLPMLVPRPGHEKLFLEGPEECVYYDGATLEADPDVAKLLDQVSNRFRAGGLHLWVMNWSRFWLSLYRRIVKVLRR